MSKRILNILSESATGERSSPAGKRPDAISVRIKALDNVGLHLDEATRKIVDSPLITFSGEDD